MKIRLDRDTKASIFSNAQIRETIIVVAGEHDCSDWFHDPLGIGEYLVELGGEHLIIGTDFGPTPFGSALVEDGNVLARLP